MVIGDILVSIGTWLLKMLLGGLFGAEQAKTEAKAKVEVASARNVAATADEARTVERKIMEERQQIEKVFKDRKLPDDDPFGFKAWNRGE
jgi:hypothetical protein